MSLRSTMRLAILALLSLSFGAKASVLDCSKSVELGERSYDLSSLAGEHSTTNERSTPPSTVYDMLRFDLCADLKRDEKAADQDQCPEGTRACLTMTNHKPKHEDIVLQVVPLVKSNSDPVDVSAVDHEPDGLVLVFSGPSYPAEGGQGFVQRLNVTLHCAASVGDPTFSGYNGSTAVIDWSLPAGCAKTNDDGDAPSKPPSNDDEDKDGQKKEKMGSGMGWFFFVMLLALGAYFGVGAYYNYSTYGATGLDLIPHRDFWREVPYMLRDVTAHMCSGVRSRPTSRGGYVAV